MRKKYLVAAMIGMFLSVWITGFSGAAMMTFESSTPTGNAAARSDWLTAIGTATPQYVENFETGFIEGQDVSGVTGLFPGGLVITDTSIYNFAIISGLPVNFGGNNPVGLFGLAHNERQYLELSFSNPVNYIAFQDIDHTRVDGIVTFVGGGTETFSLDRAQAGEFFGIYNNMPLISSIKLDAAGDGEWGIDTLEYGSPVPIPGAVWLLGSGLLGLVAVRRRKRR